MPLLLGDDETRQAASAGVKKSATTKCKQTRGKQPQTKLKENLQNATSTGQNSLAIQVAEGIGVAFGIDCVREIHVCAKLFLNVQFQPSLFFAEASCGQLLRSLSAYTPAAFLACSSSSSARTQSQRGTSSRGDRLDTHEQGVASFLNSDSFSIIILFTLVTTGSTVQRVLRQ
jgi:hypothetical protein